METTAKKNFIQKQLNLKFEFKFIFCVIKKHKFSHKFFQTKKLKCEIYKVFIFYFTKFK